MLHLGKVSRGLLAELASQAGLLPGAEVLAFVDIDSTQRRVYEHAKQGAAFGHTKIQGKTVLAITGAACGVQIVAASAFSPGPSAVTLCYDQFMVAREAPDNESLRLELQEAIAEVRHGASILTQAGGIITTGDVLLLSYGFSQKLAIILLLASASPMGILLMYLIVLSIVSPLVGLILRLERKLLIQEDSLGAAYLRSHMRAIAATLGDIENLDDEQIRALNLSTLKGQLGKAFPISLCAATIAQVGLFLLSLTVYHYRFI